VWSHESRDLLLFAFERTLVAAAEDRTSPTAEAVEQRETCPRQSDDIDVVTIVVVGFESANRADTFAVVGGDLVAQTDDDERRRWGGFSSRISGNSEASSRDPGAGRLRLVVTVDPHHRGCLISGRRIPGHSSHCYQRPYASSA
jgi:hypothetical protein